MLIGFSALNESQISVSSDSQNDSKSEESLDFRDDDYLSLYNKALASYGDGNFDRAESEFRYLVKTPYFSHCGVNSAKPRSIAIKLQFNSHRYLGLCLSRREKYSEALDQLEKAIDIDNSDPTLYFRFAVIAVKAGKLLFARNALEASFRMSDSHNIKGIRHWPSLDLIITITYKLGDCISCLRYIEWALHHDSDFDKGKRIQGKIYEEHPYLSTDPEVQKRTPVPRPIEYNPLPPKKEPDPKQLVVHKLKFLDLMQCIVKEYHEGGNGRMKDTTLPISVEFKEEKEMHQTHEVEMVDVQGVMNDILDKVESAESMEVDDEPEQTEVEKIITSILESTVAKSVNHARVRKIIKGVVDFAVGESMANSMSKRRGVGPSASFLNEVPLDLIEKRRSSRMRGIHCGSVRGGGGGGGGIDSNSESLLESPRGDDMTAKALIESLLPPTLVEISNEEGSNSKPNSPLKKLVKSPEKTKEECQQSEKQTVNWISEDHEKEECSKMLAEKFPKTSVNSSLSNILVHVTKLFRHTFCWPKEFDQTFLALYQCWRPHFVPPEECVPQLAHPFLESMLIANEIIARDLASVSVYDSKDEKVLQRVEEMSEFLWDDLQHLVLNIFRLSRAMGVRILSLHLHYYKFNGKIREAAGIADKMKPFLREADPNDLKSPIIEYEIFRQDKVDAYIENQRNRQLISKVNQLYQSKQYSLVNDVLLANLELASSKTPVLTETRLYHLLMMVETQWNLDNYGACLSWTEQALFEVMNSNKNSHDDEEIATSEDKMNLLKTCECCIIMLDGNLSCLEERARLSANLLKLILTQIDGKDDCGLGEKTVLPWILLYHLIKHDEKSMDEFEDDVPCSVNFLCSAHDYLGPLSLCTLGSGKVLTLLVDGIVDTLFKGVSGKGTSDQLCKSMEQALYCLYAHPSKKSKARHLVDHGISNIAFTWKHCLKPYLFLRPKKLPEYDDLKSASVVQETVVFFRRIIALVPDRFRIKKREKLVRRHLHSPDQKEFPKFDDLTSVVKGGGCDSTDNDESDSDVMCETENDIEGPFPPAMIDLFYLLADYYFKNSEFGQAIEFYMKDLSWNSKRIDSWVPLTLSLVNKLETKINEMKDPEKIDSKAEELSKESIKQILLDAKAVHKSFCKCIELASDSTNIRIESANFAYSILSFCGKQMSDENVENLSMEMFSMIEEDIKPNFMEFAIENYNKALSMTNKKANDGTLNNKDSNEHDERWLIFMMKGKILEKQKKPLVESLECYTSSIINIVVEQGATVPKKINFNSPPDWALELLEVYYRMHASVLKLELKDEEFPPPMETLKDIWDKVKKVDDVIRVALSIDSSGAGGAGGKSSHSTVVNPSTMSEDEPPAKVPKLDDQTALGDTDLMWSKIAEMCIKALEIIIQRFPNHFKAVHLLGRYYLRSKKGKDLKKSRKYLWGIENPVPVARNSSNQPASLFGDRKGNNLFNGLWRLPLSEVDRAGTFSSHMGNCLNTVLEFANMTKDHAILLDISILLRKPPNSSEKYLFEKQRRSFSTQAYTSLKQILKTKVDHMLKLGQCKEPQLALLLEIHQMFCKVRKAWQSKDDILLGFMTELYKAYQGVANQPTFDEVNTFCHRCASSKNKDLKEAAAEAMNSMQTTKTNREATSNSSNRSSSTAATTPSTTSAAGSTSSAAEAVAAQAAMEYINAASYYNELMTSMLTSTAAAAAGSTTTDAQAYLNAYTASYNSLLKSLPNTISVSNSSTTTASKTSSSASATSSKTTTTATKIQPAKSTTSISMPASNASPGAITSTKPASIMKKTSTSSKSQSVKPSVSITTSKAWPTVSTSVAATKSSMLSSSAAVVTAKPKTTISKSGVTLPPSVSLTKTGVSKKQFPSASNNSVQTSNSIKGSLVMSKVDPLSGGNQRKPTDAARQFSPSLSVSKVIQAELGGKPETKKSPAAAVATAAASSKSSSTVTKLPSVSASAVASAKKLLQASKTSTSGSPNKLTPAQEAMAKLKSFRNTLPTDLKKKFDERSKEIKPKPKPKPKPKNTQPRRPAAGAATSKASVKKSQPEVISLNEDDNDDDDVICID